MNTPFPIQLAHPAIPPYKQLVQKLALQWNNAGLPTPISYRYLDYLYGIANLLLSTHCPLRTEAIVTAVLNQAVALRKNSYGIEQELTVGGIIDGADRRDYLRLDLERAAQNLGREVNDENLDRYNQRLKHFSTNDR